MVFEVSAIVRSDGVDVYIWTVCAIVRSDRDGV